MHITRSLFSAQFLAPFIAHPTTRRATPSFALAVLLSACSVLASAQQPEPSTRPPAATVSDARSAALVPRAGDIIRVRVWREPDLSGDFQVSESRMLVLPKVGELNVTGMSMDSLRSTIGNTLRPDLRDMAVAVTLLRRVKVLGAVTKPGLYEVDPTMTVGDALALAGGASPEGAPNTVQLRRSNKGTAVTLAGDARISDTAVNSGDVLYVPERSWFGRNAVAVTSATISAVAIVAATLISHR